VMAGCSLLALCVLVAGSRFIRHSTAKKIAQEAGQLNDAAA